MDLDGRWGWDVGLHLYASVNGTICRHRGPIDPGSVGGAHVSWVIRNGSWREGRWRFQVFSCMIALGDDVIVVSVFA